MTIKFGTSGWRDIIADGFTFPKLRICVQAIADEIFRQKNHNKPVVVGYDTRFLSESFAMEAAKVLANNGLEVRFSNTDVPTPVVAFEILHSHAAAGINITASHNPYTYSGIKFSTSWGGPALPEVTHRIEVNCANMSEADVQMKPRFQNATLTDKLIRREDFHEAYMKQVKSLVNTAPFKKNKLKIVVDVFHGAGRTYLPSLLRELGCEVEVLNDERDVYFEGRGPDPSTEGLEKLVKRVKASKAHLGLATDGDADRFGVVDSDGTIISANDILALLAQYLHQSRQWKGILAKSVMTTHAIDAIARKYVLSLRETPVGFKYIGEAMQEAESVWPEMGGEFIMGAEESGGFTMRGHVPEKDGVLACLIVAEMVASTKSSIKELIKAFHAQVGIFLSRRVNLRATPEIVRTVKEQFATKPPTQINGLNVHRIVDIDGYKFIFQGGSWLGLRFSGTEPVVRVYTEANNEKQLEVLAEAARSLLKSRTPEHVTSRKKVKVAR